MYVKSDTKRRITLPDNYGGSAFSSLPDKIEDEVAEKQPPSALPKVEAECESSEERTPFPFKIGSEEILLLAVLLILSDSDEGADILPFILILLFIRGGR